MTSNELVETAEQLAAKNDRETVQKIKADIIKHHSDNHNRDQTKMNSFIF